MADTTPTWLGGLLRELRGLDGDVRSALERDPAARSYGEVVALYPSIQAMALHRLANAAWRHDQKFTARAISQFSRHFTGIEIHPGATIGQRFFVDHGMGVVIGETAEIGDDVTIYHGVTLGGTSLKRTKRHPTVENHVVIGAGAKVLGPVTIGHHTTIGAGSVVVTDIPPHSTVVGIPGKVVARYGERQEPPEALLDHTNLPDPVARALDSLHRKVDELEKRLSGEGGPTGAEFTRHNAH